MTVVVLSPHVSIFCCLRFFFIFTLFLDTHAFFLVLFVPCISLFFLRVTDISCTRIHPTPHFPHLPLAVKLRTRQERPSDAAGTQCPSSLPCVLPSTSLHYSLLTDVLPSFLFMVYWVASPSHVLSSLLPIPRCFMFFFSLFRSESVPRVLYPPPPHILLTIYINSSTHQLMYYSNSPSAHPSSRSPTEQ